jgi:hypothetical protein
MVSMLEAFFDSSTLFYWNLTPHLGLSMWCLKNQFSNFLGSGSNPYQTTWNGIEQYRREIHFLELFL